MRQTLEVENVKCGGCAATLKKKLEPLFGAVEVDLGIHPRKITLELDDVRMEELKSALREVGYPLSTDHLGLIDTASTKIKSFVSCAVGRMETDEV